MPSSTRIERLDVLPLNVPLRAPFTIASTRLEEVSNVAVRVVLAGGSSGYGETPTLPPVTAEDQGSALAALTAEAEHLSGRDAGSWRRIAAELKERLPRFGAVRAGLEMALLDALARRAELPLFHFFGGADHTMVTDITVPICPPEEAEELARHYAAAGFNTLKIKIGRDAGGDFDRIAACRRGHPDCRLVLDANAGYAAAEALEVIAELRQAGLEPALFEQPVAREDWEGLGKVAREAGVPVAADESCRTPEDALRIVRDGLAQVLNVKLAKCGVVDALEIAAIARAGGLGLMIGAMVETRLGIGFSAHFAAGLGGFDWIDLDTPLLLAADPISGGPRAKGATYELSTQAAGHGASLA